MINLEAPATDRIPFAEFLDGFFRKSHGHGEIFYADTSRDLALDAFTIFPVREDGLVSNQGKTDPIEQPYPTEEVEIILPRDLGIAEVRWAED